MRKFCRIGIERNIFYLCGKSVKPILLLLLLLMRHSSGNISPTYWTVLTSLMRTLLSYTVTVHICSVPFHPIPFHSQTKFPVTPQQPTSSRAGSVLPATSGALTCSDFFLPPRHIWHDAIPQDKRLKCRRSSWRQHRHERQTPPRPHTSSRPSWPGAICAPPIKQMPFPLAVASG